MIQGLYRSPRTIIILVALTAAGLLAAIGPAALAATSRAQAETPAATFTVNSTDDFPDLLLERFKFTSQSEYDRLTKRLMAYYAEKAGLAPPEEPDEPVKPTEPSDAPKYEIHIHGPTVSRQINLTLTLQSAERSC